MRRRGIAFALLALAGCSSERPYQFDKDKGPGEVEVQIKRVEETQIQEALKERPPLAPPVRIAVLELNGFRLPETNDHFARVREILLATPGGAVKDVVAMNPVLLAGPLEPNTLRLVAARMDADLLLLLVYDWRADAGAMPWQILDLLILPGFILPSTSVEVTARLHAYGIDVKRSGGYIHFSLLEEASDSSFVPSAWVRGRRDALRARLAERLLPGIGEKVGALLRAP